MRYFSIFLISFFIISCGGDETSVENEGDSVDSLVSTEVVTDSMAYFNQQIEKNPTNSDLRYKKALYILSKGDLGGASVVLQDAMRVDSMNLDVQLLYADIQLTAVKLDTSKYHYDYVLAQDSMNTKAMIGLSKLYAFVDNYTMANAYINKAIAIDPYYAEAYFMRGIIYRSDYYNTGREDSWDRAMSSFQTAVEQDPDYYSAYIEMGVMQNEKGSELALEYYRSALDIEPESVEAMYNIGMYHQNRGEVDEAVQMYQEIETIDSLWADPYYNQGYIHLLMTKKLDSSIYYFEEAIARDPNYFQAYNNLGLAYETKGDLESAKRNYQRAVEVNPDFKLAKDNLNRLR